MHESRKFYWKFFDFNVACRLYLVIYCTIYGHFKNKKVSCTSFPKIRKIVEIYELFILDFLAIYTLIHENVIVTLWYSVS